MTVILRPTPHAQRYRIVVGTSLRKRAPILAAHLRTLAWQEWPDRVDPEYVFVDDGLDDAARAVVEVFLSENGGQLLAPTSQAPEPDFSDNDPVTHRWTGTAMSRVGQNKNLIIRHALDTKADGLWFCDADLLLDRTTFASLWACDAPIACAVYWTVWHKGAGPHPIHAGPQVWLNHPYELQGRGYEYGEFRSLLVNRQRVEVWGQGACSLVRAEALEKGITFDAVPDIPLEGMMAGEDRHFCIRAESAHVPMYADAWPDIFHVYHPSDEARIDRMLARLGAEHPSQPVWGGWVSVILRALEPVPVGPGQVGHVPPQHARGRLGALSMLPELEDAIAGMRRGEKRVISVNFPQHHPLAILRGQRRLVQVTLVDTKPYGFAPVIEEELLVSDATGGYADRVLLTREQQVA